MMPAGLCCLTFYHRILTISQMDAIFWDPPGFQPPPPTSPSHQPPTCHKLISWSFYLTQSNDYFWILIHTLKNIETLNYPNRYYCLPFSRKRGLHLLTAHGQTWFRKTRAKQTCWCGSEYEAELTRCRRKSKKQVDPENQNYKCFQPFSQWWMCVTDNSKGQMLCWKAVRPYALKTPNMIIHREVAGVHSIWGCTVCRTSELPVTTWHLSSH